MKALALRKRWKRQLVDDSEMFNRDMVERAVLQGVVDTEKRTVIANLFCWAVMAVAAIFLPTSGYFVLPFLFRLVAMAGTRTAFARTRAALRDQRKVDKEVRFLMASLVLGGAAWGATLLPILTYPTIHPARLLVGGGALVGMSIVVTMLSPIPRLAFAFAAGFLTAFATGLLWVAPSGSAGLMIGMVILFTIFVPYTHASTSGQRLSAQLLVENVRLSETLQASLGRALHVANHDSLTGLRNRRAFFAAAAEVTWPQRLLMMIDIDHFKSINDGFGHAVGDKVLRSLGPAVEKTLREHVGQDCIAARLGGEEFAALMEFRSIGESHRVAEILRQRLSEIGGQLDIDGLTTTASIGLAVIDREQAIDDGLQAADAALYKAKTRGRNRVEFAISAVGEEASSDPAASTR